MTGSFLIEMLGTAHDRASFSSGVASLDHYFREQVTQDMRRRATTCYVAIEATSGKVAGYYTLAASSVPLTDLPESLTRKLPRYPSVPVARLRRLVVDEFYRRQKLGSALLWDAGMRASRSEIAVYALVVDAKDESAKTFYRHHGFIAVGNAGRQLVLPLATFTKG